MPPLPKRKYPRVRQRKRRGNHRLRAHVVTCRQCRSPRLAHRACPVCGTYRGREALRLPDPDLEG